MRNPEFQYTTTINDITMSVSEELTARNPFSGARSYDHLDLQISRKYETPNQSDEGQVACTEA